MPPLRISRTTAAILSVASIAGAAAAAYHNCFHVPFVFDDGFAIAANPTLRHLGSALFPPGGGTTVSGRPILNLSFALNYAFGGTDVGGYHAVNLAIHVLAGLVLFGILDGAFGKVPGLREPAIAPRLLAFSAALLWTVHPLQTESVTYLAQRAESLAGLFYLLTLFCFVRGAKRGTLWFALSALSCLLGVATKETVASAPVIVLLYDRTFLSGSFSKALHDRRWVYAGLAASWIPLALLVAAGHGRGGTVGFGLTVSWTNYVLAQAPVTLRYLRLAFWPHPLIFDYGLRGVAPPGSELPDALGVLALAAAAAGAFASKRASARAFGFAGLWFFALLAPTSLIPGVRQIMAEHRMYLALAPVVAVIVAGAGRLAIVILKRADAGGLFPAAVLAPSALAAAVLGSLTAHRNEAYRSELELYSDSVAKLPDNPFAQGDLASVLAQIPGHEGDAIRHYREALRLAPESPDAHNNLAAELVKTGGPSPEAIALYREAVRLKPASPEVRNNLANALSMIPGREQEAIAQFQEALRLKPDFAEAHNNLANVLSQIPGHGEEAIDHYREALRLNAGYAEAHVGLANELAKLPGRQAEAIDHYEEALRLKPDYAEAHNNLANVLSQMPGRQADAIAQSEEAVRLEPKTFAYRNDLALLLARAGRLEEAIVQLEAAVACDPGNPEARENLERLKALRGSVEPPGARPR